MKRNPRSGGVGREVVRLAVEGAEMKVEVTPGRIELLNDPEGDLPLITEVSPDGTLLFPAGVKPLSAETIVSAIKVDREGRIAKLGRR
jgi:hypothetical protein